MSTFSPNSNARWPNVGTVVPTLGQPTLLCGPRIRSLDLHEVQVSLGFWQVVEWNTPGKRCPSSHYGSTIGARIFTYKGSSGFPPKGHSFQVRSGALTGHGDVNRNVCSYTRQTELRPPSKWRRFARTGSRYPGPRSEGSTRCHGSCSYLVQVLASAEAWTLLLWGLYAHFIW